MHAQCDALGKQLVWVATSVADEPVATPLLAGHSIIPTSLGGPSPTADSCQTVRCMRIQHPY